jgi:hypothetical protein
MNVCSYFNNNMNDFSYLLRFGVFGMVRKTKKGAEAPLGFESLLSGEVFCTVLEASEAEKTT